MVFTKIMRKFNPFTSKQVNKNNVNCIVYMIPTDENA